MTLLKCNFELISSLYESFAKSLNIETVSQLDGKVDREFLNSSTKRYKTLGKQGWKTGRAWPSFSELSRATKILIYWKDSFILAKCKSMYNKEELTAKLKKDLEEMRCL